MSKTRIVLADDHPIVLNGLRNLILGECDFELVGEASNGLAALKQIRELKPDLAVLDISMPELNGIALGRMLAKEVPSVRVLVLTLHEDRAYLRQALAAGVRGYVVKRSAAENLVPSIRAVLAGGLYVDPAIAGDLFCRDQERSDQPSSRGFDLTDREAAVLKSVAWGLTNKEIAARLGISIKSAETYKARGNAKLGLKTRADLVRYASARGWLSDL
ncbi:MAG: DNA-binding response regulator [Proteobacteria bacterium]|nr:MAG: DNA-binding response regulator [Pseudomonadota bacterium]